MTDTAPAEVVEQPTTTTEVVQAQPSMSDQASAAIVAASDAAINMPDVPGRDEFLSLAMQARVLSMSGAAPKAVRDNPHVAFHVAMVGRDLGLSPSAALNLIDVIEGKRGEYQLSLSPQLLNGQLRRLGLGSIHPAYRGTDKAIALVLGPRGLDRRCVATLPTHHADCQCDLIGVTEFTWEDARMASLVGEDCQPGQHVEKRVTKGDRTWMSCGCNQGYKTYPKRMLWWRASGFAADDYFPEASMGMYSAEALGAMVDDDGRAIDPATVALPPGYEKEPTPAEKAAVAAARPADVDELADLELRVAALPEAQKVAMREQWGKSERLRPHKLTELPAGAINLAKSMVAGFEAIAKRDGWDPDAAREQIVAERAAADPPADPPTEQAPSAPQTAADADPAPDTPDDAQEATTDDVGAESVDDGPPDEAPKPKPDPAAGDWVRAMAGEAEAAGLDIDPILDEVKGLNWQVVNRELVAMGYAVEGQHIDTRRMVLTGAYIERKLHPRRCVTFGCISEDTEPAPADPADGEPIDEVYYCEDHMPF